MDLGAWIFCFLCVGLIIFINPIMWLFGSSLDDRIGLLNKMGIHVSEAAYKGMKGKELKKRSLKAMKTAIKNYQGKSDNEIEFLQGLRSTFIRRLDLIIPENDIEMADRIIRWRMLELDNPIVHEEWDFNSKPNRIKYVTLLIDRYQIRPLDYNL